MGAAAQLESAELRLDKSLKLSRLHENLLRWTFGLGSETLGTPDFQGKRFVQRSC